jgi:hypothetical protein
LEEADISDHLSGRIVSHGKEVPHPTARALLVHGIPQALLALGPRLREPGHEARNGRVRLPVVKNVDVRGDVFANPDAHVIYRPPAHACRPHPLTGAANPFS